MRVNKLVILPLLILVVLVVGTSYAFYTKTEETNRQITLKTGNTYIGIYGENKESIELNKDYTFTIENRGTVNAAYELYIETSDNVDLSKITYTISGDVTKTGTLSSNYLDKDNLNTNDKITITIKLTSNEVNTFNGTVKVNVANYIDKTPPVLLLSKETYVEGFDGWSSSSVSDNILTLTTTSTIGSPYYDVNGEKWHVTFDAYTTTQSSYFSSSGKGGYNIGVSYYNSSKTNVESNNGHSGNGLADGLTLNTWVNNISWDGYAGYGSNVKYIKLSFSAGNIYSQPTVKIRNFKVHGQLPSSFYDVNVNVSDSESGVKKIKYASGNQNVEYFKTNGTNVVNNTFRVTSNGIYTVYAENNDGYGTVSTIEINKIQ